MPLSFFITFKLHFLLMPAGNNTNTTTTPNGNTALNAATNSGGGSPRQQQQQQQNQQCAVREQDRFMPIANVIRIMRKVLPSHAKISDDAKETIQECVSEYISFITSEANDRCQREQRKTITAEDVLWAMNKLGFDDYVEPLTVFLHKYREVEGDHRGSIRGDPLPPLRRAASAGANLVVPVQPPMAAMPLAMGGDHLMQFHQLQQQQQQHQFGGYGEHVMGGGGYFFYGGGSVDGGGGGASSSSHHHHHHQQQQLQNNNGAGAAPNGGAFDPYSGNFK